MRMLLILLMLLLVAGISWGLTTIAPEPLAVRFVASGASSLGPGSALLLAVVSVLAIAAEKSAR